MDSTFPVHKKVSVSLTLWRIPGSNGERLSGGKGIFLRKKGVFPEGRF
jgi:hypothetical protein